MYSFLFTLYVFVNTPCRYSFIFILTCFWFYFYPVVILLSLLCIYSFIFTLLVLFNFYLADIFYFYLAGILFYISYIVFTLQVFFVILQIIFYYFYLAYIFFLLPCRHFLNLYLALIFTLQTFCSYLAKGGANSERSLGLQPQQHRHAGIRDGGGLPDVQVLQIAAGGAQDLQHGVVAGLQEQKV